MTPATTWDPYVEQKERAELPVNLTMKSTFPDDISSYVVLESNLPSIYERLRQILPSYDMEFIAERNAARQKLAALKVIADGTSASKSAHSDSCEEENRLSLESETFAEIQIESITLEGDFEE